MGKFARFFEENGKAKRLWNSPWLGVPLWLTAASFTAYWHFRVPFPGYAIGALAVVAGIMSVRDIKVIGKIAWIALLVFMLIIEFRAIDKDRADNQQAQKEFFAAQQKGFAGITTQAQDNFKQTATSLQTAINGLNTAIETANQTLSQTHPHAELHFAAMEWANPSFPIQLGVKYEYENHFVNDGNETAILLKQMIRIYPGKPDDLQDQKRLANKFEEEWKKESPLKEPESVPPHTPRYSTVFRIFEADEYPAIQPVTIYKMRRLEYRDSTGTWQSDACQHMQVDEKNQLYLFVNHPCHLFTDARYRPKPPRK